MIIYNIEQGSEAWFAARCGRVTGTRFKDLVSGESTDTYKKLVTNLACEIITSNTNFICTWNVKRLQNLNVIKDEVMVNDKSG